MALATGGTITYVGGYEIHTFTTSGTFTPSFSGPVNVLVIAGGGSGAVRWGGGGGAGGFLSNSSYSVTSGIGLTVTVGNGGASVTEVSGNFANGNPGQNSVFGSLTAIGGGAGLGGTNTSGGNGGSGGGGCNGAGGSGTVGQGNAGGSGTDVAPYVGGGGGGAGAVGSNYSGSNSGNGGIGLSSSISGTPTYYAGGGGGATFSGSSAGTGGSGGGGNGADSSGTGTSGTANTGGGGGASGGASGTSGAGGSGIVIVSFPASSNITVTPSVLSLTSTLYAPTINIVESATVNPSLLNLTSTLYSPTISVFKSATPTTFSLVSTLYSPELLISSTTHPSLLTLTATFHQPNLIVPGLNELSFASAIISYNPLLIVSNTSPIKLSIVDVSTPDSPIYTTYTYTGCNNALAVNYNSELGMIYIACADGIILEIDASSPMSYTINYTGASGNLTSLTLLPAFFDVYAGTDYSTGEIVNMYEGSATTVACDVRFSASYQSILGTQINTINTEILSTDIRFVGIVNNIVGCDIRFISLSYADLSITPIARTDFVVYIGGVECPDVKLDSIEITHTADEKSQATFILARKHDNVNYVLNPDGTQGTYIPVLGHPTVQITIKGNEEFGYDTPAYIWDVDCKSENEQVKIVAYSELPKQDERSNVTLSIPLVNEKLHVYHALVNNPVIDNPVILPDDINPPFYLGILIDNGYTRIENITQFIGFSTISQDESQFVNYVFGSGDSGVYDINGNDIYFKPLQNWTYFWFGHATNFITGQTWTGLLNNGSSYLGTSPSSLTTTTWDVDYINFWYQREFPNSVYRGSPQNVGSAIVYPSDFLGIVPFPYNPDPYDKIVNINPFNGNTTIDQVLRDHTPMTFTGADILNAKTRLAVFASPGSVLENINGINYLVTLEGDLTPVQLNMSTKILDLIDSKFGITFGDAPYKKVSSKSGILTTVTKWEDAPNGLFYHKQQGYNYVNYTNSVGEIEFKKIQNINGSVLPKTKCDIEIFLDGYYYYNIQLLKRINIDQTTQTNIYDGNNGFPVSVKSIHISSKDMKVTLDCTNAWSRLELLELEGQIPDPYYSLIPEVITEYSPKFDPNSLTNTT